MLYNEKTLLEGNAFQYEARLTNQVVRDNISHIF